jgi:hypothetical protein
MFRSSSKVSVFVMSTETTPSGIAIAPSPQSFRSGDIVVVQQRQSGEQPAGRFLKSSICGRRDCLT